jgi:dihydrofolate synthase/folylpolyglutamate synthase
MVKNKSPFEELYQNNEFKHLDLSLNRIIKALNEIAFDERDLGKIIHIAGTNGKGSTAKFISDMLLNENYNVALYTSPHIDTINERIVYNGEPIKDNEMNNLLFELKTVIVENELSYFEALTFLAFKYFSDKKPQFSIIETGLGGRFDATNVLNDKLPVITSISFDHAEILGKNIFKIADEKLAIVKNNKEVFIGYNKPFIRKYITQQLNDRILIFADKIDNELHYPYPYCYNYILAKSIFHHLIGKKYNSSLPKLPPCRFESVGRVIFDGTHTANGLLELFKNFIEKPNIIFSLTKERNLIAFVKILKKFANSIYLTEIPGNDRSTNIDSIDITGINLIKNPITAIDCMLNNNEDRCILITGSFYLCAFLRKYLAIRT